MTKESPKLIVFDLNKTLIKENTWEDLNKTMGVTRAEDDMLMGWGKEGIISDAQGQAILSAIYKMRGDARRSSLLQILGVYKTKPSIRYRNSQIYWI